MREPPAVSGIVLAGGRANRFGRDKLAEPLDGRPLLHHAIDAVGAVADEVIVVVAPDSPDPPLPALRVPIRVVRDPIAFGGPLVGLLAGLEASFGTRAVALGGDMPSIPPLLLDRLVDGLANREFDIVALVDGDLPRSLPIALRVSTAIPAARGLRDGGEASIRALFRVLRVLALGQDLWRDVDPDGGWRRDIDRPADLR